MSHMQAILKEGLSTRLYLTIHHWWLDHAGHTTSDHHLPMQQVGLAIGDINHVKDEASLRNLALKVHGMETCMLLWQFQIHFLQVELVLEFEELLPTSIRRWLRTGYRVVYPDLCDEPKQGFSYNKGKEYYTLQNINERKKPNKGRKADHLEAVS